MKKRVLKITSMSDLMGYIFRLIYSIQFENLSKKILLT